MKIVYLESNNLFEKRTTKPSEQAARMIADSGLFSKEIADNIIDALIHTDIHAFVHAEDWLSKYIKGIARMMIEEAGGNPSKAINFLEGSPAIFDEYLTWIRENRNKSEDPKERLAMDNKFINEMSYQDVKDFISKLQADRDVKSKDELSKMEFSGSSDYELIPIKSYDDFHSKFGGKLTGNGTGDGSEWCHANGSGTYKGWTENGEKFFVLAKKGFENIPFDKESNLQNPKDEYGNSLIALLVDRYGNLMRATLRCNHMGIPSGELADKQYKTYAELSKLVGFNVEEKVKELRKPTTDNPIKDGVYYYDGIHEVRGLEDSIKRVVIKDGVTKVEYRAFRQYPSLTEVVIPNSVTEIGDEAFYMCTSLKNIEIPNSVTEIKGGAFAHCTSLENVILYEGLKGIGWGAFAYCTSLKSIKIPDSVKYLMTYAFQDCTSLVEVILPNSINKIQQGVFWNCSSLVEIEIPDSVIIFEGDAFQGCTLLKSIALSDDLKFIGNSTFEQCPNLTLKFHEDNFYAKSYCVHNGIPYEII